MIRKLLVLTIPFLFLSCLFSGSEEHISSSSSSSSLLDTTIYQPDTILTKAQYEARLGITSESRASADSITKWSHFYFQDTSNIRLRFSIDSVLMVARTSKILDPVIFALCPIADTIIMSQWSHQVSSSYGAYGTSPTTYTTTTISVYTTSSYDTLLIHQNIDGNSASSLGSHSSSLNNCSGSTIHINYKGDYTWNARAVPHSLTPGKLTISDAMNSSLSWSTDTTEFMHYSTQTISLADAHKALNISDSTQDSANLVLAALDSVWDAADSVQRARITQLVPSQKLAFCKLEDSLNLSWSMVFNVLGTSAFFCYDCWEVDVSALSHKNTYITSPTTGDTLLTYTSPLTSWDSIPTLSPATTAQCTNGAWKISKWKNTYWGRNQTTFTSISDSTKSITLDK